LSQIEKNKKKDRSNAPVVAGIASCILSVYGFSNENALFLWVIPLALMSTSTLWAFWPRSGERSKPSGDA
jgi:hypothetical protein